MAKKISELLEKVTILDANDILVVVTPSGTKKIKTVTIANSFQGPSGADGAQGAVGPQGPSGLNGSAGMSQIAYIRDERASGVQGGGLTTAIWNIRPLNVLSGDTSFVSLAANRFTLQVGTYSLSAGAVGYGCASHKIRLRSITASADILYGTASFSHPSSQCLVESIIDDTITVTSPTVFEIQQWSQLDKGVNGMGYAVNIAGVPEIYARVKIIKIA
jgi:hypothetical protein